MERIGINTFIEMIKARGIEEQTVIQAYANKLSKGVLGNLLEEVYFGYKANSNQEADFPEAGVELKRFMIIKENDDNGDNSMSNMWKS